MPGQKVNELGGLFIPAHINRPAFGLMAVLGLLPDDFPIEALEISRHLTPEEVFARYPDVKGYPILQNGDVHYLDDFLGGYLLARLKTPRFQKFAWP